MVTLARIPRPFVVGVVVERTAAAARRAAIAAFREGAAAVELNLASLTDGALPAKYFEGLRGAVYTSCRRAPFMQVYGPKFARVAPRDDETRVRLQLEALAAGSAGLDLEADTFAPTKDEWTNLRSAVRRQREAADHAHRMRRAVIYSWHPGRKLTATQALRAVQALRQRGGDFVKIVERVASIEEALDSCRISLWLSECVDFPFVFLPLGPGAEKVRPLMPAFGAAYLLARPSLGSNNLSAQPLVSRAFRLVHTL